ncbi:N-acetyltransferase [Rhizocola hellebori]|uniref:N-acetyltransferase n=1 Tax=Rhizocola hellebori TaxID=1392758 RepID=A0A8J3VEN4_9ACTN|nr:N-acetyltransferase [Rhizocola hellebori]
MFGVLDQLVTRLAGPDEAEILGGMRWAWSHEGDPDRGADSPGRSEYVDTFADLARAHTDTHPAYLSFVEGEPVGMAWLALIARPPGVGQLNRYVGDIQSVYVAPQWRNRGVGGHLMATIIAESRARGLTNLSVRAGLRPRPFYHRIGFTRDGGVLDLKL